MLSAEYGGARIDINIMVDKPVNGSHHADVVSVAQAAKWPHGTKRVVLHTSNKGLVGQWIDSWKPDAGTTEMAVFLEDDLEVSKCAHCQKTPDSGASPV